MPVVEAVQTFVGITNENEFYSHHYLSEVLKGDIRERMEQWAAAEEAHPEQLDSFQHVQQGLLQALGYAIAPQHLELQAGMPVSVWQVIGAAGKTPQVLVVPAYNPG